MHKNTFCSLMIWLNQVNQIQKTVIRHIGTGRLSFIFPPQSSSNKTVVCLIYLYILGKHGQCGWRVWIFGEESLCFIPQLCKTGPVLFPSFQVSECQSVMLRIYLLMACSSSVMPVSLNARLDSSRLRAMALCRSSLSSPVRSITSTHTRTQRHEDTEYTFTLSTQRAGPTRLAFKWQTITFVWFHLLSRKLV